MFLCYTQGGGDGKQEGWRGQGGYPSAVSVDSDMLKHDRGSDPPHNHELLQPPPEMLSPVFSLWEENS